ncbi:hypothetical protein HON52_01690 [Candidatus Uhrbacteria bacterium]|jgi:hypothetical protein|nr:hypothetical protein [Candidatus Uhrbacteria bacterium]
MGLFSKPSTPPKDNSAFSHLNAGSIGTGKNFREGSYSKARGGLKGQLNKMRRAGMHSSTANISKKNMEQMHDIVAKRLKNKVAGGKINYRDKRAMKSEAYKLMKDPNSKFSKEDLKDFKKVVDKLGQGDVRKRAPQAELPQKQAPAAAQAAPRAALQKPSGLASQANMSAPMAKGAAPAFAAMGSTGVKGLKKIKYESVLPEKPAKIEENHLHVPEASEAIDIMID